MGMLSIFQNIRTLRIKFLAIVLPSIVFCFIVFSIVFAFLTYRDMEIQLDIEARKIADLQSKALALPLWNYLDENVKQTLDNLLMNPDIIKAVVRDTKGQVITQAGKADDKGIYKGEEAKVHISITDSGSGISQENLEKLFEPLFTTKARGIGAWIGNIQEPGGGQRREY